MDVASLKSHIHTVSDFPKSGIRFRDITPLLANPEAFSAVLEKMAEQISCYPVQALTAIEARGFIFGSALAAKLHLPFYLIRKAGKLPQVSAQIEYALEYGVDRLEVHLHERSAGLQLAIVDDVLATGGTAEAVCKLVEYCGAQVCCMSFLMELEGLNGRERLARYPIETVLSFDLLE